MPPHINLISSHSIERILHALPDTTNNSSHNKLYNHNVNINKCIHEQIMSSRIGRVQIKYSVKCVNNIPFTNNTLHRHMMRQTHNIQYNVDR